MFDLIIVGAGIMGSTLARMAIRRGLSVELIGLDAPSSLAALALSRPAWSESHAEARAWYEGLGAVRATSALVSRASWPEPRRQEDWLLIDPGLPLLQPSRRAPVSWFPGMVSHNRDVTPGRLVVVSAPAHGLLPDSYGTTVVGDNPGAETGLYIHWLRPYHHIAVVVDEYRCRLGSSVARTRDGADDRAIRMIAEARDAGLPAPVNWMLHRGQRYGKSTLRSEKPGLVLMEGMARSGYAEAPRLARELLDRYDQLAI